MTSYVRTVTMRRWNLVSALLAVGAALAMTLTVASVAQAQACANPIVCENQLDGTPRSQWDDGVAGEETIQGYATQMSVNRGQTISFKIKTATSNYKLDIYRVGWYDGDGARLVVPNVSHQPMQNQPTCLAPPAPDPDDNTGLIDCGNWAVSASWAVPATAVSGVYFARVERNDNQRGSLIPFIVRNDASNAGIVYQTSDQNWQAYNTYGGNSLYNCTVACPPAPSHSYNGASKVSYNRPFVASGNGVNTFWYDEYPMVRFLERNGYDISYIAGMDAQRQPGLLNNHKIFLSSGHDEYWSGAQRTAVENARDNGLSLAFFSGNEVFWRTRFESSIDGSNTQYRTLTSYKDTHYDFRRDPVEWTGTWRDPRFTTEGEGIRPENALTGQSFVVNAGTSRIMVPAAFGKLRFWRNTAAESLTTGSLALAPETLGYEWDVDADNGYRPPGSFRLSSTTVDNVEAFLDYGSETDPSADGITHNMTLYRAASGALVFGAGTIQWSWGLDTESPANNTPDTNMQQATVNLFADMDVQPATRMSTLQPASKSTDTTPPTSTLNAPATVADGAVITLSGTATDGGGGDVAGIEVSTNGGTTWHPATTGTTNWTYSWLAHGAPTASIKVRATDDSGNTETPGPSANVNVTCPCSMFGNNVTPTTLQRDSGDTQPVEVGFKFKSDVLGTVTGIRFYKATTNTGTHVGSIWTSTGTRLASATFTSESASGWQTVTFSAPVTIEPNTVYVASYFAPAGHYSGTNDYFWRTNSPGPNGGGITEAGPLKAIKATDGVSVNGVYSYGAVSTFPTSSFRSTNYWVDVTFTPTPIPGQVTNVTAVAGGLTSANLSWTAPSSGGPASSYRITPYIGATAQTPINVAAADTNATVTGLTTGTTYTFRVQAVNANGSSALSAASNAVTPNGPAPPSAPTAVLARPATNSAQVSWTLPVNNGDSAITGQTITPYIGGVAQTPTNVSATATSAIVTGLTNGTEYTFRVRATNGVGAGPQSTASSAVTPQSTVFDFATPTTIDSGDSWPVELGMKFTADHNGTITGIRFYKAATNTGTHVGNLWTAGGTKIGSATFTNESASGWQTVTFATPVSVTAGTTYVASYFTQSGHNSATTLGMTSAIDRGPLHTLASTTSPNGVYNAGGSSSFPTLSFNSTNYWVDVMYALPTPGQVTGVSAAAGGLTSAHVTWTAPASGGPVAEYRITPYIGATAQTPKLVPASSDTSATVTGLTNGATYTFRVEARNANGSGPVSAASNAVTPTSAVVPSPPTNVVVRPATSSVALSWTAAASDGDSPITNQTVIPYIAGVAQAPITVGAAATSTTVAGLTNGTTYTFRVRANNSIGQGQQSSSSAAVTPQSTIFDFATPTTIDSNDTLPVELGMKFKADHNGWVTGVRFFKAATNTGTHIGNLWATDGTRLATATFSNETATGWQTVTFSSPIAVTAGTTYVASYFTPTGHNSFTGNGLAAAIDNGPLHTIASSVSGNGVYRLGGTSAFPSSTFNATNYWVDVLFALPVPGQPTAVSAASGGLTSANVTWTAPASGGPVSSYRVTPYIGAAAQAPKTVPATDTSATVTGLTNGTTYTFRVEAVNANGPGPMSAASNAVTPLTAVVPAPPTAVLARPATSSAQVSWTAPASNGDSAITSQTVIPYIAGVAQTPVNVSALATSATITGLTNGTTYTFRVRANNAIGQGPASSASSAVTPQSTIFDFTTPTTIDSNDTLPVELGMKFKAQHNGWITGVRFYKAAANAGTHIGNLWATNGTRLATATFTNETATGWQTVTFASPVAVTAGTTYIASYFTPTGHNSFTSQGLSSAITRGPLQTIAATLSPNGVYALGGASAFPSNTYNATNYWVDVLFALPQPGQVTGAAASAGGSTSAHVTWTAPSSGGPVESYRITPYVGATAQAPTVVPASADTSATVTGLTGGTTYTFRVEAVNANGSGPASAPSNSVTPAAQDVPTPPTNVIARPATASALVSWELPGSDGDSPITGQTVTPYLGGVAQTPVAVGATATSVTATGLTNGGQYTFRVRATNAIGAGPNSTPSTTVTPNYTLFDFTTPTTVDSGDTLPVELGVKFRADSDGWITGVRFYKSAANTGTHTGNLWAPDGTRLATATFTGETATGWQTVTFASPVPVTAGAIYIASYHTPSGHNAVTSQGLAYIFDHVPLHTVADTESPNGVYAMGASSSFPGNSYNATNYWVDVLFAPLTSP